MAGVEHQSCSWERSLLMPKKSVIVERLWAPSIHWSWARNWNCAATGAALTASRVANKGAVSTPLRVAVSMLMM